MRYQNVVRGIFEERKNRFVATVWIGGKLETVHVKNTGRCRELLFSGAEVYLTHTDDPKRKTAYDLIGVYKEGLGLVNIDSQAPNRVVGEWLREQNYDLVKPEHTYGKSRFDFYLERGTEKTLLEVKGCTLEVNGIGYFPDAPTERGVKHLRELTAARSAGYRCAVAFVIQMPGITEVRANAATDPDFAAALEEARRAGVEVWELPCEVGEDWLRIRGDLDVSFLR